MILNTTVMAGEIHCLIFILSEKSPDNPPAKGTTEPEHLEFKLNKSLENAIELAKSEIDM